MPAAVGTMLRARPLLRVLQGRHGLPVGILDDLAGVFHAAAQRWDTGLKAFVDRSQADELFAEGCGVAQAEQHNFHIQDFLVFLCLLIPYNFQM